MNLSLVIPCYNEGPNLPALLERCRRLVVGGNTEVILVDNGSTDDTPEILPSLLARSPSCRSVRVNENRGYGFGIVSGLRVAHGAVLGWTHADMQTDPTDALRGLALFEQRGGNIFVKGLRRGRPLGDVVFTVGMSLFETMLLGERMWDINAQPTMFTKAFFATWDNPPDDFALDLYAYFKAKRLELPIHRFPVEFGNRLHGISHWNVGWRSRQKFIRRTIEFSLRLRKSVDG